MKLSLNIKGAKRSQQCDAASLFGGFWKVKTLVDMHNYVWAIPSTRRNELSLVRSLVLQVPAGQTHTLLGSTEAPTMMRQIHSV
jgi:hypothetical protein